MAGRYRNPSYRKYLPQDLLDELRAVSKTTRRPVQQIVRAAPFRDILQTYRLDSRQFAMLLDTPAFVAALRDAQSHLREHGAPAGFVFRWRALAEDLLPDIYALAEDERSDAQLRSCAVAQLRHRIFESLARYAQLNPASMKKGDAGGVVWCSTLPPAYVAWRM